MTASLIRFAGGMLGNMASGPRQCTDASLQRRRGSGVVEGFIPPSPPSSPPGGLSLAHPPFVGLAPVCSLLIRYEKACLAQLVRASVSYAESHWFKSSSRQQRKTMPTG